MFFQQCMRTLSTTAYYLRNYFIFTTLLIRAVNSCISLLLTTTTMASCEKRSFFLGLFLLLTLLQLSIIGKAHARNDRKALVCYFGSWSTYRWSTGKFDVEDIDPFLCTHLVFGFAGLDQNTHTIKSLDPYNDLYEEWGRGAFQRFTGLKEINPGLKTLLAIGGWNEGSTKYSEMASTPERRAVFIQSALDMVLEHNFDGLDLDWEYPGTGKLCPLKIVLLFSQGFLFLLLYSSVENLSNCRDSSSLSCRR